MIEKLETNVYFTPREAARHFNLSLSAIKNYIYANKLKTLRTPGGHHRISKDELLAAMGEKNNLSVKMGDSSVYMETYCMALLNAFKLLGSIGNSFIIHSKRVSEISYNLSNALSLTKEEAIYVKMAGLVHDIGHMAIGNHILLKSEPLTAEEYELIKFHPAKAKELLNSADELKEIGDIVIQHHERIDGAGYPKGLTEKGIKKTARVISIAEAYDSMVSEYSYKKAISKDMAIAELVKNRNTQFDGDIVEIFIKII